MKNRPIASIFLGLIITYGLLAPVPAESAPEVAETEEEGSTQSKTEDNLDLQVDIDKGIDILCEANLYYTWRKIPKPKGTPQPGVKQLPRKEPEPIRSFFQTVGERGLVMKDLKNRLSAKLERGKAEALVECSQTHEDEAGCLAASLRKHSTDYSVADYSVRKAILEAARTDCSQLTGKCLSSEAMPIECRLSRPSGMPIKQESTEKAGKKGKKNKK